MTADILFRYRRPLIVGVHLLMVLAANSMAFLLRFDGAVPEREWNLFVATIPFLLLVRGLTFIPFRIYQGLWRYAGIWDLRSLIVAVASGTMIFTIGLHVVHWLFSPLLGVLGSTGLTIYPRSILIIDALILVFLLGGLRLGRRFHREMRRLERHKRILIYGAGDAGEMIVRDMRNNPFYEYEAVGFVDDDAAKLGRRIHGLRVLGTGADLESVIRDTDSNAVLIAIANVGSASIRSLVSRLEPFGLPVKVLPNLDDLVDGKIEVSRIRNLSIQDLLQRPPVGLDAQPVRDLVEGKRILVTGAAGSIGSELCRQLSGLRPSMLMLFDRNENGLFVISNELARSPGAETVQPLIGDVTDEGRVNQVMSEYLPDIVFHAAAHKHVPIMEANPCEAVKNNVLGTRIVLEASLTHDVERFILISTDKAVNPVSVMGATKRIGELMVQSVTGTGRTVCSAVRFGNVLGSSGSVVPLFMEQIDRGGPVTVTDKDMRRYMMLTSEAVELVLHTASLAEGGEIFILSMGEQVRILDVARQLISLSGFVPDKDIPIVFTGIRAGEKLCEELTGSDETIEPSKSEHILYVPFNKGSASGVQAREQINDLIRVAELGQGDDVILRLVELIPEYEPKRANLKSLATS